MEDLVSTDEGAAHDAEDVPADIRSAFARDAASVWVVTCADGDLPSGFTAISVRSVSVEPPIISFNLGKTTSSRAVIESTGRAAAHLLTAEQEDVARTFAGDRDERFRGRHWRWHEDGLPEVADTVLRLSGDVVSLTDAGDSLVVLLQVNAIDHGNGEPLLHYDRAYRPVTTEAADPPPPFLIGRRPA
jgi:flavin reductase (DIM6/NTAB) family NADH-FMN oxidoreductase RutF